MSKWTSVKSEHDSDLPEVGADASTLLQRLCKHLVLADVVVGHRPPSKLHRFLEVTASDLRHRIVVVVLQRTK